MHHARRSCASPRASPGQEPTEKPEAIPQMQRHKGQGQEWGVLPAVVRGEPQGSAEYDEAIRQQDSEEPWDTVGQHTSPAVVKRATTNVTGTRWRQDS